jgi:hypothetical protein
MIILVSGAKPPHLPACLPTGRKVRGTKMVKLRRIICVITLSLLAGCTYPPYRYSFSLIDPYVEDLTYEDGDVFFQFIPTAEYIWVSIYNRTDGNISFVRDEAEYIDPWGESHNILFGWNFASAMKDFVRGDRYSDPIRINPKSASEGSIWINIRPTSGEDIGVSRTTAKDSEIEYLDHNMLPEYEFQGDGMELKDSTFYLILPVSFDGYKRDYEFTFMITDVEISGRK